MGFCVQKPPSPYDVNGQFSYLKSLAAALKRNYQGRLVYATNFGLLSAHSAADQASATALKARLTACFILLAWTIVVSQPQNAPPRTSCRMLLSMVGTKEKHWVKSLWTLATHDAFAPFLQRICVACSFEIPVWTHKYVLLLQYSRSHSCERFSFFAC